MQSFLSSKSWHTWSMMILRHPETRREDFNWVFYVFYSNIFLLKSGAYWTYFRLISYLWERWMRRSEPPVKKPYFWINLSYRVLISASRCCVWAPLKIINLDCELKTKYLPLKFSNHNVQEGKRQSKKVAMALVVTKRKHVVLDKEEMVLNLHFQHNIDGAHGKARICRESTPRS